MKLIWNTKDNKIYTLNWLKNKFKYHWKLNQLLYWDKNNVNLVMIHKGYFTTG